LQGVQQKLSSRPKKKKAQVKGKTGCLCLDGSEDCRQKKEPKKQRKNTSFDSGMRCGGKVGYCSRSKQIFVETKDSGNGTKKQKTSDEVEKSWGHNQPIGGRTN